MPFTPDDRLIDKLCDVLVEHNGTIAFAPEVNKPTSDALNLMYLAGIVCGATDGRLIDGRFAFMQGVMEGMNRKAQAEADAELLNQDPPGIDQWGTNGGKEPDESGC